MYKLSQLIDQIQPIAQPKLVTSGVGMWLVWDGPLSPVVGQIFTDFGGFQQAQDGNQALWFFFGDEAFKALGRLTGYARVNRLPIFIQAFPASLLVGYKYEVSLACADEYAHQEAGAAQDLEILVHPQFKTMLDSLPGLGIKPTQAMPGLSPAGFGLLSVDATMGHDSPLGWYFMLRPLGDPLDKNDAEGWRAIFSELQALLERLAIKYLSHEGFLIFGLDNVKALRNVSRELLKLEGNLKQGDSGKKYWPCVMACVFKKGFHLNKDLPKKINLDWKQLAPDYPHMSFKSALYLGKGFRINDVRHSSSSLTIESWCHISLSPDEEAEEVQGELPFKLPTNLVAGTNPPCFYCGLSSHLPRECPTRLIPERRTAVWDDLGLVDMGKLDEAGLVLNRELAQADPSALARIMDSQNIQGLMLRSLFEISFPGQLRCLSLIWRSKGKDLPGGFNDVGAADDGDYLWGALDMLRNRDEEGFEREITQGLAKYGRGFQPRSIQGFLAMEEGDWSRSAYFWQEAARSAFTPLQRGWLAYLEGRAMEVQGEFQKAVGFYHQVRSECPRWADPVYRQGVCMVKMGFTSQGLHEFMDLLRSDPNIFNRVLLDPEVERGRVYLLSALWKPWSEAMALRDEKAAHLPGLPANLKSWFKEDHPFLKKALEDAKVLDELAKINNYVCFNRLAQAYDGMQKELHQTVEKGIISIDHRLKNLHEELKNIHHEAAWFPFGKLLREFNKDFNSCASKLNWMRTSSLQVATNFRKSQDYVEEIEATITLLRARLVTLRIVRDATLFVLLLGKSFMWIELVGLALSLIAVPGLIFISQKTGQFWLAGLLEGQKWQVQKGLVIIVSIVAMAAAAIKTAVSFEKRRAELFKEEEDKAAKRGAKAAKGKPAPKALPSGKGAAVPAKAGGGKPAAGKGKGK
ncbi:tetratricopeptide repeat protein [Fundidesulfovibrio terrae]|uniref:tetratricopeptide repeat protein n=1 Tax=Fundidesulfovibrio terrae TaxID=2922866 RepID=UPI001FAEB101|nr:tetratricopeptide repeat protein [Fundidesulfovibrio terrae]